MSMIDRDQAPPALRLRFSGALLQQPQVCEQTDSLTLGCARHLLVACHSSPNGSASSGSLMSRFVPRSGVRNGAISQTPKLLPQKAIPSQRHPPHMFFYHKAA